MKRSPLRTYEGQIKAFLVLLVLFLAVAIYCNVHLLVIARKQSRFRIGKQAGQELQTLLVVELWIAEILDKRLIAK